MLRNILKTFFITLILFSLAQTNTDKNTLLNLKVRIDNEFRQTLDMEPKLYKIWIGTTDGSDELSETATSAGKPKTYIPGLPGSAPLVEEVYATDKVSQSFNYIVDIYIDDSYDKLETRNLIKGVVLDVWPAFGQGDRLEKNLNFKVMSFQAPSGSPEETNELQKLEENQRNLENALAKLENDYMAKVNELQDKNDSTESLEAQIAELTKQIEVEEETKKSEQLEAQLGNLNQELDNLRLQLQEEKDVKNAQNIQIDMLLDEFEQQAKDLQLAQMQKQSEEIESLKASVLNSELALDENIQWRLQYLEGQFTKTQRFKDSLLNRMGSQLDKINFPPEVAPDTTKKDSLSQNNEVASGSGWVLWLAIGLLGLLIILSLVAIFTNKKKVIYLKPKDQKAKESDKTSSKEAPAAEAPQNNTAQPVAPASIAPTHAPIDEGVMQSEIRTQRQSAVAMSAGQKEGATQIVKDWLEESKNEENSEE
ncbi:MAG: hypothetical protein CMG11_04780 [Candidatus Marinimicrobia bacterium]|nr:hypothetical protein [Candidatus Neomarinimicrobiota bacterium]